MRFLIWEYLLLLFSSVLFSFIFLYIQCIPNNIALYFHNKLELINYPFMYYSLVYPNTPTYSIVVLNRYRHQPIGCWFTGLTLVVGINNYICFFATNIIQLYICVCTCAKVNKLKSGIEHLSSSLYEAKNYIKDLYLGEERVPCFILQQTSLLLI
jgi:hypothetical protein